MQSLVHKAMREEALSLETPTISVTELSPQRLALAKAAYTTRRVPQEATTTLLAGPVTPRAGDLVLARVEKLGQHRHLELATGRRAQLYVGDEIVVCYGNRYAPDQFEALVPQDLQPCHLVAAGGVVAQVQSPHDRMKRATTVQPLGLLGSGKGQPLNLVDWALKGQMPLCALPSVIAVVGSSMNAGKTTTAVGLIKGLRAAGLDVGAAKVTGTGAGGDVWSMLDAGAFPVVDFTDAGFPSTYRLPITQVEQVLTTLVEHVSVSAVDAIVLEVADGLYQDETAGLLTSATFATLVAAVLFAANDAMGAMAGVEWLRRHRLPVLAVSGALTQAPLAMREAQQATHLSVLDLELLCSGDWPLDLRQVDAHGCALTIQHAKLPTAMLGTSGAPWAACPRGA